MPRLVTPRSQRPGHVRRGRSLRLREWPVPTPNCHTRSPTANTFSYVTELRNYRVALHDTPNGAFIVGMGGGEVVKRGGIGVGCLWTGPPMHLCEMRGVFGLVKPL